MQSKDIISVCGVTLAILMVPLVAMQFTSEVDWTVGDFTVMGILLSGTGCLIALASRKIKNVDHRAVLIVLLLAAFLLIWADLAVGIFNIPGISGS